MSLKFMKGRGQWEMLNLFRLNSNISECFDEKRPENFFLKKKQSQRAAQLKSVPSISAEKNSFSKLPLKTGLKSIRFALLKSQKLKFFLLKTSRENLRMTKSFEYDRV